MEPARSRAGPLPKTALTEAGQASEEDRNYEFVVKILNLYAIKLKAERESRLGGNIPAADLYARQVTYLEVWADLTGTGLWGELAKWREQGHPLVHIAQTPMSRLLDEVRRRHFAACGEPERPPPVPDDLLEDHGRFSTEPTRYCRGGGDRTINEQLADFAERYRRDAQAQVEWEARATRDYEERRAREGDAGGDSDREAKS